MDDIHGKTALDVFGDEVGGRIRAYEEQVLTLGQPVTVEEVLPMKDGPRVFLNTRTPHRDSNGNIIGVVAISP